MIFLIPKSLKARASAIHADENEEVNYYYDELANFELMVIP